MDVIKEAGQVAHDRWEETSTEVEKAVELAKRKQGEEWQLASAYVFRCYDGYKAFIIVLWRSNGGIEQGFVKVKIKAVVVEQREGIYSIIETDKQA